MPTTHPLFTAVVRLPTVRTPGLRGSDRVAYTLRCLDRTQVGGLFNKFNVFGRKER